MAVAELARIYYAASTILDTASSAVGLSKRAALGLAILEVNGGPMTNVDLQNEFVSHGISTEASVKKDASAAKSELLERRHIEIRDRVSVYAITQDGRRVVQEMCLAMGRAVEKLALTDADRALLRQVVGLPSGLPSDPPLSAGAANSSQKRTVERTKGEPVKHRAG